MLNKLNLQERRIYVYIQEKNTTKQIAGKLNIPLYEVKETQKIIYKKLNIHGKLDVLNGRFNTMDPANYSLKNRKRLGMVNNELS
jgi:DNA-binding CsgD family transcriptional regulator